MRAMLHDIPDTVTQSEPLLDIEQAARFLNVSETSLRRWTNDGRLACLRVGRRRERRFRRADLLAFLEREPAGVPQAAASPAHGTHLCGSTPARRARCDRPFSSWPRVSGPVP